MRLAAMHFLAVAFLLTAITTDCPVLRQNQVIGATQTLPATVDRSRMNTRRKTVRRTALLSFFILLSGCAATVERSAPVPGNAVPRLPPSTSLSVATVHFPSLDEDITGGAPTNIKGLLVRPGGPGPFPAVVALHGCSGLYGRSGRLSAREADWATRLVSYGYVVLFPDSFTPRNLREVCTRRDLAGMPSRERPRDAYGALLWLQSQDFVRKDRIALMGWSHGGSTILAAVAKNASVRPPSLVHDFRGAVAFYPGCRVARRSADWSTRIPLTILIGKADDWTPAASCISLVERVKKGGGLVEIVVYEWAHHGFDTPGQPLRVRSGLARTTRRDGTATVGTDYVSRADAMIRVEKLLKAFLGP